MALITFKNPKHKNDFVMEKTVRYVGTGAVVGRIRFRDFAWSSSFHAPSSKIVMVTPEVIGDFVVFCHGWSGGLPWLDHDIP